MQPKPKKPPDRSQPHLFSSLLPSSHSLILRLSSHSLNLEIGALCGTLLKTSIPSILCSVGRFSCTPCEATTVVRICFNRPAPCCQSGSSHSARSEVTLPCLVLGWSNLGNYSTFGDLRWPIRPQRSPPWKPSPADWQLLSVSLHCRHLVFRFAFQDIFPRSVQFL
uniref:Uncharacterized protein n=1 Tax=Opuntia streptacantha TaxID=393608 RepID=A0A7C8ZCH8_OPUST